MTATMPMLETYPRDLDVDRAMLAATIDTVLECGEACTECADACLSEDSVAALARCIRLNMDCADVCSTTARILSRHTAADVAISRAVLEACVVACASCAAECAQHADMHEHCRICAEACRRCEQACRDLLAATA